PPQLPLGIPGRSRSQLPAELRLHVRCPEECRRTPPAVRRCQAAHPWGPRQSLPELHREAKTHRKPPAAAGLHQKNQRIRPSTSQSTTVKLEHHYRLDLANNQASHHRTPRWFPSRKTTPEKRSPGFARRKGPRTPVW